ncbi:flagellar basal body-associated FliL family protein [Solemya velesiana gill symbiont]|uniref:Flagellar protein FliL n=1 Tax=Solemya velesiana gill symbiont TaxID=1918948 RepID=A0A1T2KWZ9_9GAMM|nr:flagellar basal body-associated FliL family protein [Solemya velesiana gill symbiont]OOZ37387.1 hypothetical protein BOW51_02740 [Solemya velesiana gill symbiont]
MRFVSLVLLISLLAASFNALAADDEEAEKAPKLPAVYHSLSPSQVANLQEHRKYIRCDVQLMTKGDENAAKIKMHDAALRHEMLLLLGDQKNKELKTPSGKEKLLKQALKSLQQVIETLEGDKEII